MDYGQEQNGAAEDNGEEMNMGDSQGGDGTEARITVVGKHILQRRPNGY